jgi:hypothetical protein
MPRAARIAATLPDAQSTVPPDTTLMIGPSRKILPTVCRAGESNRTSPLSRRSVPALKNKREGENAMFATTKESNRTQLQQSLDREQVPAQPQEIGIDVSRAFDAQSGDPSTPIFCRNALRPKTFQTDLFGGRLGA